MPPAQGVTLTCLHADDAANHEDHTKPLVRKFNQLPRHVAIRRDDLPSACDGFDVLAGIDGERSWYVVTALIR